MYTDEQFEQLEQEERVITDDAIAIMLLLLNGTQKAIEKELRDFYSKYGRDGVVTYAEARKWIGGSDHRKRLTVLLAYVQDKFDELQTNLTPELRKMLEDVTEKEVTFFNIDQKEIADKPLTESWGTDEKTWKDRLNEDVALWCAYILIDVKQHLLKNKSIDELITKLSKRFKYMESVLKTLGLSESTAIGSIARRLIFKILGINRYQFYTKADERTCEICGSMHGLIFPLSAYEVGVTASPLHPRCRCWEVPIRD